MEEGQLRPKIQEDWDSAIDDRETFLYMLKYVINLV